MLVQFLWTFVFRRSGKDDEGGVEDEAAWDWQSVVVPASPNRVMLSLLLINAAN